MTPLFFSKEWAEERYSRFEVQTALQELEDYIDICTEYPPHVEVWQALEYLENKDAKTFQACRNFRKGIYASIEQREQGLRNLYHLIRRQFGDIPQL